MIAIAKKELKRVFKERGTLFWLIGLPILFIVIFAMIFSNISNNTFKVHYTDLDQSSLSKQLITQFNSINGFDLVKESDQQGTIKQIKQGKLSTYIVIPKGFANTLMSGQQAQIHFYYDGTSQSAQAVQPVRQVLTSIISQFQQNKLQQSLRQANMTNQQIKQLLQSPIKIDDKEQKGSAVNAITQIVPGYTVMFVFFIIISISRAFIKDRESGMLSRLMSTPMTRFDYLLGMWIPYIIMTLIQVVVLFGFGHFVYHLNIGNLPAIILVTLVMSLFATSLGLVVSFLSKSEQLAVGITQIITMGGAVLGGLWFPLDLLPPFIQKIALFIPQYWAQKAYVTIMARDGHLVNVLPSIGILSLFTVICIIISLLSYKQFYKGAIN